MKQTKIDHERKFGDFFHRISANFDSIKKLKQYAEEQKMFQEMIVNKTESIVSRVNKVRDNILEDLKKAKDDLQHKIDETDKICTDQFEIIQASLERSRQFTKDQISKTKEEFHTVLRKESDELKGYINQTKEDVNKHKDTL